MFETVQAPQLEAVIDLRAVRYSVLDELCRKPHPFDVRSGEESLVAPCWPLPQMNAVSESTTSGVLWREPSVFPKRRGRT